MDMWYFARICAHTRSWREFAKCRFAHYPSFFSIHVDTYVYGLLKIIIGHRFLTKIRYPVKSATSLVGDIQLVADLTYIQNLVPLDVACGKPTRRRYCM